MSNSDAIFLQKLQQVIQLMDEIDSLIENNGERQSVIDSEISDWLHVLQNDENLTNMQIVNVSKKIRQLRKERESLRNEYELTQVFIPMKNRLISKESRKMLYFEIQKRIKGFNQPYKNRIITEQDIKEIKNQGEKTQDTKVKSPRKKYVRVEPAKIKTLLEQGFDYNQICKICDISHATLKRKIAIINGEEI